MEERPIRVVVADDEPDIVWMLEAYLRRDGRFDVVGKAADGRAAVKVACHEKPDVVVLDVGMPLMSGDEAATLIEECAPEARIVFYSIYPPSSVKSPKHLFVTKQKPTKCLVETIATSLSANDADSQAPAV